MRFVLLSAFFALISVLVTAKAGQHAQHGGAKHDDPQGGLQPGLNGTLLPLNTTSSANVTSTEPSATGANSTVASST